MRFPLIALIAVTFGATLSASPLYADDPAPASSTQAQPMACPICSHANVQDGDYAATSGTTFVRGASNTLLGWTEILRRPAEEAKAGGNVLAGVGKGVATGVGRTVSGIGEILTFWVPKGKQTPMNLATDCPLCMGRQTAPPATASAP